jgi:hypothetical protein
MKHYIITRINFKDLDLLDKYLRVTKEVLIPCLKAQTVKDFTLAIITNAETVDYLREQLDFPFVPFYGTSVHSHMIEEGVNIQTRHDCDDFMSKNYVETIQKNYYESYLKYDSFIIQSQPVKLIYDTGEEKNLPPYHERRCSMFLSLCQREVTRHVFERKHGQMYEISQKVLTLPVGHTKWVIHGNNLTLVRRRRRH